jgi:hypothetical protein
VAQPGRLSLTRLRWIFAFWIVAFISLGIALFTRMNPTMLGVRRTFINIGILAPLLGALIAGAILSGISALWRLVDPRRTDWELLRDWALIIGVFAGPVNWTLKFYGADLMLRGFVDFSVFAVGIAVVMIRANGNGATQPPLLNVNKWLIGFWILAIVAFAVIGRPMMSQGFLFWGMAVLMIGIHLTAAAAGVAILLFAGLLRFPRLFGRSRLLNLSNLVNGGLLVGIWGGPVNTTLIQARVPTSVKVILIIVVILAGFLWASRTERPKVKTGRRGSQSLCPPV